MKVDVLLGLQWGDEGKGKIVDALSPEYDIIARFQGGPNAGHTLILNDQKFVLHLIPSGIFRKNTINIIGDGVVLDPVIFYEEVKGLEKSGLDLTNNLYISEKTSLILPTHRILDAADEAELGNAKIGSTGKGIGPAYIDKVGRNALRVGDIRNKEFNKKYERLKTKHLNRLKTYDFDFDISEYEKQWFDAIVQLKKFRFINCSKYINEALNQGKKILAEGAQGTLLDINAGTYPFVTSSTVTSSGVCSGLGVAPSKIGEVFGIFKAYTTRVGSGPFPTELFNDDGKKLQEIGGEFGATTGRERRCGWLDIVALKYAIEINGVTQLVMTKADVLSGFESFKVSEEYCIQNKTINFFPFDAESAKPVFKKMDAWKADLKNINDFNGFPEELKSYVQYVEAETNVPVTIISTGPEREAMIDLRSESK
jgi:adenylosuccinate synthase